MKILQIIHDHPFHPTIGGGGSIRVKEFSLRLAAMGHQVHILSGWFEGCEGHTSPVTGCKITFLGPHRRPACKAIEFAASTWVHLTRLASSADVVVEDFSPYSPIGTFRLIKNGTPVVLQIQNYIGAQFLARHGPAGLPLAIVEKWMPRFYPHRIFQTEQLAGRFPGGEITRIVPSGIDAELLDAELGSQSYVAFLGRIDYQQKGLDVLLAAVSQLKIPVWIAGDGPDRQRLEREIMSLPNIRYLGKLAGLQKRQFLKDAAFMALPSRFEGQMMVVSEAAALGIPSLVSDIPELRYVTEQKIGFSFSPNVPAILSAEIEGLWNQRPLCRQIGAVARLFARKMTWEHHTRSFEAALEDVVNASRSKR